MRSADRLYCARRVRPSTFRYWRMQVRRTGTESRCHAKHEQPSQPLRLSFSGSEGLLFCRDEVCQITVYLAGGPRLKVRTSNAARQGTVDARGVDPSGRYRLRCVVESPWRPARVPAGTPPTMIVRLVADIQNRLFWGVGTGRASECCVSLCGIEPGIPRWAAMCRLSSACRALSLCVAADRSS
jgi:hypothetical protein